MIPNYFVALDDFKPLTPTKARIQIPNDEPLLVRMKKVVVENIKCHIVSIGEDFLVICSNKKYYMVEEHIIKELSIKIGDLIAN